MQQNQNLPHQWSAHKKTTFQQQSEFTLLVKLKPQYITSDNVRRMGGIKHHSWKQERINRNGKDVIDHRLAWMEFTQYALSYWSGKYITLIVYWNKTDEIVMKYINNRPSIISEPKFSLDTSENIKCVGFEKVYNEKQL